MADDADAAAREAVEVLQHGDGVVEFAAAEAAEAFVDEEDVGAADLADVAECQGQRKRDDE